MKIVRFDPFRHYREVAQLWERALGESYPVTERVLRPRICTRPTYEDGDGLVATEGGRIVGFGIVELDRAALDPIDLGTIQALVVDPARQREGIGGALLDRLEGRLREEGCARVRASMGLWRFWSGVPQDLPTARAFFEAHGYGKNGESIDMFGPLDGFRMAPQSLDALRRAGAEVVSATSPDLGPTYDLLTREARGWRASMLAMINAGDMENLLLVKRGEEVIGQIQTYTPHSRCRGANVVWERIYGEDMGGFGAVLIADGWRGKGLGVAMIQAAAQHLLEHGATGCYVDWTGDRLAPFYAKVGARTVKQFGIYSKEL